MFSNSKRRISTHHFQRFQRVARRGEREPSGNFAFDLYQRLRLSAAVLHIRHLRLHENVGGADGVRYKFWRGNPRKNYAQIFNKMSKKSEEEGIVQRKWIIVLLLLDQIYFNLQILPSLQPQMQSWRTLQNKIDPTAPVGKIICFKFIYKLLEFF